MEATSTRAGAPDATAGEARWGSRRSDQWPESAVRDATANPLVYRKLHRYVQSMCRDPHFADDLVQDAIVRAIEHARDFRGDGSVDGWLKAIARTTFLMAIRARRELTGYEAGGNVPSAEEEALEGLGRGEAKQALEHALSEPDRQLVDLYYGLELPISKIAALTRTTEGAVKCRLYRLRRRVAESTSLAECGYGGAGFAERRDLAA
jgi:RNA polymerase sigma-70 factor, ECF subfamily